MERINEILEKVGCGLTDLPKSIQERIESIGKLKVQLKEAQDEYETNPTEEVRESLESVTDYYEDYVEETCEIIEAWDEDLKEKANEKAKTDAEKKAQEEAEKEKQNQPPVPPTPPATEKKEKKGIGLGGIILGVAVLAITMGAVNTMRSK
jgi:chromosome segregation ATPase